MAVSGSSRINSIGLLADQLESVQNPSLTEELTELVDSFAIPKISVRVLSDTLKFTIVQILIKGEITEPALVLDLSNLIGATAQSSIANITGTALPYLPPFDCMGGSLEGVDCNACNNGRTGSSNSNICLQDPALQSRTTSSGDSGSSLPNDCINCLNLDNSLGCQPVVINKLDLIGFAIPENWWRNDPAQLGIPLISGIGPNSGELTYAIAEADNISNILEVLGETGVAGYYGKWVPEGACQYRFYIVGVDIIQLQTEQLLSQLRAFPNLIINGNIGTVSSQRQGFYKYEIFGQTYYQTYLTKTHATLPKLLAELNAINYDGYTGSWVSTNPCQYVFQATVTSLQVSVEFDILNYQFLSQNWRVETVEYGVQLPGEVEQRVNYIMYVKELYRVKIGVYPKHCQCIGPYQSIQYILTTIVNPEKWFYPQTRVFSEDIWTGIIFKTGDNTFYFASQLKEVVTTIRQQLVDWNSTTISKYYQGSIVVETVGGNVMESLVGAGWVTNNEDKNGSCHVYTNELLVIQVVCQPNQTNIQGDLDSLEIVIQTVIIPNNWNYYPVEIPSEESLQIIQLHGDKQLVRGNQQIIEALQEYYHTNTGKKKPVITREKMELLVHKYPLENTLSTFHQDGWSITQVEDGYATIQHNSWDYMYGQLYQSDNQQTNIWASSQTIQYIDKLIDSDDSIQQLPIYSYPTDFNIAIWPLHEYGMDVNSPFSERFQIIATNPDVAFVIPNLCRNINQSEKGRCSGLTLQGEYSSVTIRETPSFIIDQILQYKFPNPNIKWSPGLSCCEQNGPCTLRLIEIINGNSIATQYFVEFNIAGGRGDGADGSIPGAVIISGEPQVLSNYIYPIIEANQFQYNVPNTQPVLPNGRPPIIGKVVGFTGLVSKQGPSCGSKPKVAINALSWNLTNESRIFTDDQGNDVAGTSFQPYAEILWENYATLPDCKVRGEPAFVMTGTGNYAIGILGSVNGNELTENGGQPPIPNNAEYASGNILLKTNGPVYGSITMEVIKYSGWWNKINLFDKNTDNLQQAIQANQLIYRDWIRVMKHRFEEANFVPWLINQERMNRDPVRPGPWNKALIVHTVAGQLTFIIPSDPSSEAIKDRITRLQVQQEIQQLLSKYLNKPLGTINLGVNVVENQYTVSYSIPAGTVLPQRAMAWLPYANKLRDLMDKLPESFDTLKLEYPNISTTTDLNVTTNLNAFAIDSTSTSKLNYDYSNLVKDMVNDFKLGQILIELENQLRGGVRPTHSSTTPDLSGAYQQIGGLNAANQSRWLETQVHRTLYGSEFPVPLLPPDSSNPNYRFPTGEPVFGFYQNAWATGVTTPLNMPPPLVIPPPNSLTNQAFTNIVARQRRSETRGGNTMTYSR